MPRTKTITDEAIVACAREVFLERGASASTKEIARRAGISEAVIFQRFPTKSALFLAAMVPNPIAVDRIVAAADAHTNDPREAIRAMAHAALREFRHHIPPVRHLIASNLVRMEDLHAHFERVGQQPIRDLSDAIAAKITSLPEYRGHDTALARAQAGLLIAAIHNLVAFDLTHSDADTNGEQQVNGFVDAAWHGIRETFSPNERTTP